MFDNIKNQINQTPEEVKLFTGLTPVKVLAINPTEDQLKTIIGDAATKFDTTYAIKKLGDDDARPVNIWVQDLAKKAKPQLMTINLINKPTEFESGYYKIINDHNRVTISTMERIKENPKMSWYSQNGMRKELKGENTLYTFIQRLVGYNVEGEKSFTQSLKDENLDFESVYNGNFDGLRNLVDFAEKQKFTIVVPYVVRENAGKYYQDVLINPDVIFRGHAVNNGMIRRMKTVHEKAEERGYALTNKFFTYEFQEFNEADCVNAAPAVADEDDVILGW